MTETEEVWKTIPGYPDYEVSSLGRVRSHRTGSPKILKGYLHKRKGSASRQFSLFRGAGGEKDNTWIPVLVMESFAGPTPPGHVIKHKDGDTLNNSLDNLFFAPAKVNVLAEVLVILESDNPDKVDQACQLIREYLNKQ